MKTAFITGITGMVGSHLADFLYENTDWNIVGLTRWRSPLENIKNLIDPINNKNRVKLIYGDLNDDNSLDLAIKTTMPDYVFHLAAQSFPLTSFTSPVDTLNTNILGTARLLEAIKKNKPECIVHVCASSEVFGRVTKDKLPINEECLFHPASPYAISKTGTDLLGRFYAEAYKMNVVTTRMFTHTGPRRGDVFAESSFAKQIAMIEAGYLDPVIKVGNLNSLRTVADVRDAVRAYYMLVTINPIPGEYYNIGGTHTCEIADVLNTLLSFSPMQQKIQIEVDPERLRPIDADLQVPNTEKFYKHTGWKTEIPFRQTMEDLLNYWRQQVKQNDGKFLVR